MWFELNIGRLIEMLLPELLRKSRHLAWLNSLLKPLKETHEAFVLYRHEFNKSLRYNGQVIILENLLNNIFDSQDRGIVVKTNPSGVAQVYLFNKNDNQPVYVAKKSEDQPVYIYQKNENILQVWDFEVIVPDGILTSEQESQLKSIVNKYKLDGKRPQFLYQSNQIF